ncbi:RNA polymerase subunit sigma [Sporosarcina sp. CAU 1771]
MSLKGIELQIAIPKTVEAGKLAEQKQQQSQLNQDQANALTERQTVKNRETVIETENLAKTDEDKNNPENSHTQDEKERNNEKEKPTVHPYKGSFVDFTG